jgi:hypothetical protein
MRSARAELLLAILISNVAPSHAATGVKALRPRTKQITGSGRFIAQVPFQSRMSVGLNYQSYIFELDNPNQWERLPLVKISYRFALRDPEIPQSFFAYSLLHTFKMHRDESCDETWSSISKSYRADGHGIYREIDAIIYSRDAPTTQIGENVMLSCYVVTPDDYRSTKSWPSSLPKNALQTRNDEAK